MITKGKASGVVSESRVRVRYAETDQMGVVYHANHFIWFEIGRVELLRQLGFSYRDMEQDHGCFIRGGGRALPLQSAGALRRRDFVRTHLKNVRESVIHFGYELVRAAMNACWRKARPRTW